MYLLIIWMLLKNRLFFDLCKITEKQHCVYWFVVYIVLHKSQHNKGSYEKGRKWTFANWTYFLPLLSCCTNYTGLSSFHSSMCHVSCFISCVPVTSFPCSPVRSRCTLLVVSGSIQPATLRGSAKWRSTSWWKILINGDDADVFGRLKAGWVINHQLLVATRPCAWWPDWTLAAIESRWQ